ncbi:MAG: phosphoglycerate dehydrogenase [Bacteroidales bacterium]
MTRYSLDKSKIRVLLLEGIHENAVRLFQQSGYTNIEYHKAALSEAELAEKIRDAHIIGIRSRTELHSGILEQARKLIAIGCYSIGTNQVDIQTAKLLGIPVFNAPFSNTRSVAEMVIAEAIMLIRGIPEKSLLAHQGKWVKSAKNSFEIRGKTLGIVGYGHIGSQVSILAECMGMNIIYFDIEKKLNLGNARPMPSLKDLLAVSDIVTLHVPSTELTRNMIGEKELAMMKKGSYLINASRGEVVNYEAVGKFMATDHILGVAADVFPEEPSSEKDAFVNVLQQYNNVILTPHIGGSTSEAQANIGLEVAEKLIKYSDTGATIGAVNFVEISLSPNTVKQRFLHIHKNQPGVLREVNYIFTSRGINIASVYLQTDPDIGYVIIDTDSDLDSSIIDELRAVPHTIRTRMLY